MVKIFLSRQANINGFFERCKNENVKNILILVHFQTLLPEFRLEAISLIAKLDLTLKKNKKRLVRNCLRGVCIIFIIFFYCTNRTGICTILLTGLLSRYAGVKRHFFTASNAAAANSFSLIWTSCAKLIPITPPSAFK